MLNIFHCLACLFLALGDLHELHSFAFLWVFRKLEGRAVCGVANKFPPRIDVSCDTDGDPPTNTSSLCVNVLASISCLNTKRQEILASSSPPESHDTSILDGNLFATLQTEESCTALKLPKDPKKSKTVNWRSPSARKGTRGNEKD